MSKIPRLQGNRPYKPLVKNCMDAFIKLFNEIDKIIQTKEYWLLYSLSPHIELFGDSVLKMINKSTFQGQVDFCLTEQKMKHMWKGVLKIPPYQFVIKKDEIKTLCKSVNLLKEQKIQEKILKEKIEPSRKEQNVKDFLIVGGHSSGKRYLSNVKENIDLNDLANITLNTSIYFENCSMKEMRHGADMIESEEGINLSSEIGFSYSVVPLTPFATRIDRSFRESLLEKCIVINGRNVDKKFEIPNVFNGNFDRFSELVWSLFVEYYLGVKSFDAIKVCDVCGALFLERKKGSALYCSDKCRRIIWAKENKETEDKSRCRNRQNVWFSRNMLDYKLREYKDFCEGCNREFFPKGGQCPAFIEKHGEKVEEYKNFKKGKASFRKV